MKNKDTQLWARSLVVSPSSKILDYASIAFTYWLNTKARLPKRSGSKLAGSLCILLMAGISDSSQAQLTFHAHVHETGRIVLELENTNDEPVSVLTHKLSYQFKRVGLNTAQIHFWEPVILSEAPVNIDHEYQAAVIAPGEKIYFPRNTTFINSHQFIRSNDIKQGDVLEFSYEISPGFGNNNNLWSGITRSNPITVDYPSDLYSVE